MRGVRRSVSRPLILMPSRLLAFSGSLSILLVVIGSLLPAAVSPVMRGRQDRLPVNHKVLHYCAYTSLGIDRAGRRAA